MGNRRTEILMTTCNGEKFLREQMDSILAQTAEGWHLSVSDDGSTDGTGKILEEYAEKYPDKISITGRGKRFGNAKDHFLWMIRECEAEWMMLCDQDDTWAPEKVSVLEAELDRAEADFGRETPLLLFCDQVPADEELRPLSDSLMRYQKQYTEEFDWRSLLMQNVVTGGAMAFNRALKALTVESGGAPEVIMHDWWMAAAAARFGRIVYIDKPLGTYRQHGDNAVGAKAVGSGAYTRDRLGKLGEVRAAIRRKKAQARAFRDAYRTRLTGEDLRFLDGFIREKSGIGFYLKYGKLIHGAERKAGFALLG